MQHFYNIFVYSFASLFSIINPVGMSAVFLAMTKKYPRAERRQLAYRVALYGTILLIATFFLGPHILNFFGISLSCIQVAGGMLVFYSAWGILDPKLVATPPNAPETAEHENDPGFFPLTMPITAGAGAMAVTMALAARLATPTLLDTSGILASIAAIIVVFIMVAACYRYADSIFQRLGPTGTNVVSRLTAFILLAISISVIWEGLLGLIMPVLKPLLAHATT